MIANVIDFLPACASCTFTLITAYVDVDAMLKFSRCAASNKDKVNESGDASVNEFVRGCLTTM